MVALNFKPRFAERVRTGAKTQTIRKSARVTPGQAIQLYTGQRTAKCQKLGDAICTDCMYVGLTARGVTLGNASKFPGTHDDFARADGFADYDQMWEWFKEQYDTNSFTGFVIRWRLVDQSLLTTKEG